MKVKCEFCGKEGKRFMNDKNGIIWDLCKEHFLAFVKEGLAKKEMWFE